MASSTRQQGAGGVEQRLATNSRSSSSRSTAAAEAAATHCLGGGDRRGRVRAAAAAAAAAGRGDERQQKMAASDFKLFGRWPYDDVNVSDLSLVDYLAIKGKAAVLTPHTAGRYQKKRFRKALCPLVERLVNSLMMHGRNSGKKLLAIRIVQHAFDIIALMTDKNPLQVLVQAVERGGPREDSTRIGSAGVVRRQAVDVSPLRRVNQAIYLICTGA
ncbi:40S ribosomal protein S5, putative, partial [Eimeria acervulina]